jgi:hypothetical protein
VVVSRRFARCLLSGAGHERTPRRLPGGSGGFWGVLEAAPRLPQDTRVVNRGVVEFVVRRQAHPYDVAPVGRVEQFDVGGALAPGAEGANDGCGVLIHAVSVPRCAKVCQG